MVSNLCDDLEAEQLIEMKGEKDNVHFLFGLNPRCAPNVVSNNIKFATSQLLSKESPAPHAKYREPVLWSRSHFDASVSGAPLSVIKQYVEPQARPL
jgi:putative transposase